MSNKLFVGRPGSFVFWLMIKEVYVNRDSSNRPITGGTCKDGRREPRPIIENTEQINKASSCSRTNNSKKCKLNQTVRHVGGYTWLGVCLYVKLNRPSSMCSSPYLSLGTRTEQPSKREIRCDTCQSFLMFIPSEPDSADNLLVM